MRLFRLTIMLLALTLSLGGCLAPRGDSPAEKRSAIQQMKNDTLEYLYKQRPTVKEMIDRSAGYAVFSNINGQYLFVGGGGGYGVATDRADGRETYMRMAQVGVGLGLGMQDIRVVFVFHTRRALDNFVFNGWEFGGQADAAAKANEKGDALTGELTINPESTMYTLTQTGLMAKVNLAGTKYWRDDNLN